MVARCIRIDWGGKHGDGKGWETGWDLKFVLADCTQNKSELAWTSSFPMTYPFGFLSSSFNSV